MEATTEQARVLCVDDEPNVLEGLRRHLRRVSSVEVAQGGQAGLDAIERLGPFAVVTSDLRMPEMDGIAFLGRVRERAPDTVRILLTGNADLTAAVAAVNEGHIFRFLTKPCPPETLLRAVEAAVAQHHLITAERVLLEQTLRGSVKALTDVLALTNPAAFGRGTRAKQLVTRLLAHLGIEDAWAIEVAAMVSQLGCVTLPSATADKHYHGQPMSDGERAMVARLPEVTEKLLANIPRLESVREILVLQDARFDGGGRAGAHGAQLPLGARLLKLALDWDSLEGQGLSATDALGTVRGRQGWYDPDLVRALGELVGSGGGATEIREIRLREARVGMVFAADVFTDAGLLLIARGQEVTDGLLERIRNFSERLAIREPIRMLVQPAVPRETRRAAPAAVVEEATCPR